MSNWNRETYRNRSRQEQQNNYDEGYYTGTHNTVQNNETFYNGSYENQVTASDQNLAGGSSGGSSQRLDIRFSKLHATAAEFKPRVYTDGEEPTSSAGAVKKTQKYKPKKQNFGNGSNYRQRDSYSNYDSGRYDNRSRVYNRSEHNTDKSENQFNYDTRYDKRNFSNPDDTFKGKNKEKMENNQKDNKQSESLEDERESNKEKLENKYYKNCTNRNNSGYEGKKKWNKNNGGYKNKKNDSASDVNWRNTSTTSLKEGKVKKNSNKNLQSNQRERLEDMLERNQLECMVCCERLRFTDAVWSCKQCYNILHLSCIKKWAITSKLESGWRCPACQNTYASVPKEYYCYCEKRENPKYEPGTTAHSCGEMCGRKGRSCDHNCVLLCHPGPCPECTVSVKRACGCGLTTATVLCNTDVPVTCQNVCNKLLNCGVHVCVKTCHAGDCRQCTEYVRQECFCGKVGRKVPCTTEVCGVEQYECEDVCGKQLECRNHTCTLTCHSGSCPPCAMSPEVVTTCPCGQTKLDVERKSCFDPVATCDKVCNKILKCGQPSQPHRCLEKCHVGDCPTCPLITMVRCRCGYMDKELSCSELTTKADDARCQKKCTKMRLCCKHKCNQFCCIEVEHHCSLLCNRMLSCGLHRCEQVCHRGRCAPCPRVSFEELFCECGASMIYPPVPCGTRPPSCNQPCSRPLECGHPVVHKCHTGQCPPCTVLCTRWCYGGHEQRSTIFCHQNEFSCGLPCGRDLPCGQHKCIQPCHTGRCPIPCVQLCPRLRQTCDHPCNQPCHRDSPCPETPCKQTVQVTCQCGLRTSTRSCVDLASEYQAIAMSQLASKMADIQKGQTVDLSDIVSGQKKHVTPKTLECTEECRVVERNRRLAIGLQIRNPDFSAKLTPRYSDYMRAWAKKDARFCQHVHDKLTELVHLAKQSKQKSRSHSFETMNRDKRHLVHEYCQHFGCESEAYDAEPNRNVVATASRDKSWLPSVSLLELIQRENGQRKVPGPMLSAKGVAPKREVVSLKVNVRAVRPQTPPGETADYFDPVW